MTASNQDFTYAYQADTVIAWNETAPPDRKKASADSHGPHVLFPPSPIFSTEISPEKKDFSLPLSKQPFSEKSASQADDTLDLVALENQIATGIVAPELPSLVSPANAATAKRPLSELVHANPIRQETFKPSLEVDEYRWPAICKQLAHPQTTHLDPVISTLQEAAEGGRTMIGFLGAEPHVGCTTLLLSVAKRLAESGSRVAVVDADFSTAAQNDFQGTSWDLASQLGLAIQIGWEDVLAGRVPLAESVIHSIVDRVAILPIIRRSNSAHESLQIIQTHGIQASVTAGVLRYHYDLVLVDLGCAREQVQISTTRAIAQHCRLDATMVVTNDTMDNSELQQAAVLTSTPETICLGRIENCVAQ